MGLLDLVGASITFYVPMPKSWSKKKKAEMDGKPHLQKPDLDNFIKALLDALYSTRYTGRDDTEVWRLGPTQKVWADVGAIEVLCEN